VSQIATLDPETGSWILNSEQSYNDLLEEREGKRKEFI